ncbi:VWA domain-containing protein [Streptomyces sp. NPDC020801]|uniref:VWA domain-containing protein n=1 Tax=unclassified Streptomyces TaxID=2593676 RepID=UPI0037BAE223
MRSERSKVDGPRTAVVYLGPPTVTDGGPATAEAARAVSGAGQEACHAVLRTGLFPLSPVRTVQEADTLLAEYPDAVLCVHPGGARPDRVPAPGSALWNLLRCGAGLRLCETGSAEASPSPEPGSAEAFLVVELPVEGGAGNDPARDDREPHAERVAECRAFAATLGLPTGPVLAGDPLHWGAAFELALLRPLPPTAVVHPGIAPPAPDSPDGLLWRWLRSGREIRSAAGPVTRTPGPPAVLPRSRSAAARLSGSAPGSAPASAPSPADPGRRAVPGGPPPARDAPAPSPRSDDIPGAPARLGSRYRGLRRSLASDDADDLDVPDFLEYGRAERRRSAKSRISHGASGPRHRPAHSSRRTGEPLPHDGLFIRRNNAFGTRSPLGVRDLIEQGVIIGQEQIRFDDFVAARTDQVPGPPPGRAVAVSHGLAAVQGDFRADEATTHFLEITLKAGEAHPGDTPAEPLPVNFVFVVDTSGSMHGEKLDCVKAALQTLYDKLRPADCLGIITFDHHVRTVLAATAKRDLPPERFAQVVSGLTAGGGTDINLGVQYGIDEIGRNALGGRTVNCLYLFSDGDPTSGERDWVRIRTNVAAKLRGDLTLSCFGFGSDARMPELAALAGLAGGHSTFVTRPEQVGADLLADLNRRDHLAAIDIQLRLDIAPDVEIRHLYGHDLVTDPRARAAVLREVGRAAERARQDYGAEALPDIVTDEKGIRIFAPDLAFGETYWIVLELAVPPGREVPGLGTATVQYVDTVTREGHRHELDVSTGFTLSEETVTVHAVGLWTSEVTFHALDDLYDRDRDAARKRLTHHIQVLRAAHSRLPAPEFRDDQVTLQKLITLTGTLDTVVSFSDTPHGPGPVASAVMAMSDFGRVRSGFWPHR